MRVFLMISFIGAVIVILRPGILVRPSSTLDHLRRPIEAMKIIAANPFGLGLGSAGPAQNRVADPCLDFPAGSDISWAKDRPGLCIFVDHVQKQPDPSVRSCRCPFLPENWYLQIGIELGVIGLVLYLTMVFVIARSLWDKEHFTFPIFVALSVAALFLHAFEDSAVVYTLWILLSASLPVVWEKRAA